MSQPINKKGKPFSWSFTALADYEGCPRRYSASRFYCTVPFQESAASIWGSRIHRAAELFLKAVPHKDEEALLPVEPYCTAILRTGHKVEAEVEVTLTRGMAPTSWFAKDAWFRAKLDVVVTKVKENSVSLLDWKTGGKIKDAPDQLKLCAAALAVVRPYLQEFTGKYIWTQHKQVTGIEPISKIDIPKIWQEFLPRVARMEEAWRTERFDPRPSGLCPWCAVPDCPQRRGERRV